MKENNGEYRAEEYLTEHFVPPKLPEPVWEVIKASSDAFRQKDIFHSQEFLCSSLKPLLSLLEDCADGQKEKLTTAIQLICSAKL